MKKKRGRRRLFHLDHFGRNLEASLDDELRFHLETRIEEMVANGMSPEEAREAALEQFGDLDRVVKHCREIDRRGARRRRLRDLVADVFQDVRFACRSLWRTPGFTAVAMTSLAIGIGVNAALFTAIHAVWLAPVPGVTAQDRVVDMVPVVRGHEQWSWTYPDFESVRDAETPFAAVAAWAERDATFGTGEGGRRIRVAYATAAYFDVLGTWPVLGRAFLESAADSPGGQAVAVVSHHFWQDRLGGGDALGRSITLDGLPYTVIGVAAENFRGARVNRGSIDLWLPMRQHPGAAGEPSFLRDRSRASVQVLGRLRPDATLEEARAAVQAIFANLAVEYPETNEARSVKAVSFGRFPAQNRTGDLLAVVFVAGLMVVLLLIICGNLAGMSLARSAGKEQEIGVRLALGSSRARLVRLLMVEALLLSLIGGGLGIALATAAMRRVSPLDLNISAYGATFEPSGWAIVLALGLALVAAQAFGLLPALRFSRPELVTSLKDDSGGGGQRVGRFQRHAAAFQIGTAFLLLLLGALFYRSLDRLDPTRMGFQPGEMAVADFRTGGTFVGLLDTADEGYPSQSAGGDALLDGLIESIGALPGVESVALSSGFPLDRRRERLSVTAAALPVPGEAGVLTEVTRATEGYFRAVGTPILQGRALLRTDDHSAPAVAVITRTLADRLWPGVSPLGRQLSPAGDEASGSWTVVGVVGDVASSVVSEDLPHVFVPLRQSEWPAFVIVLRTALDPSALVEPVRRAVRAVDADLPAPVVVPGTSLVAVATQEQTTGWQIAGGLGLAVLLLSAMGVHGVVALAVTNRTREIGVRIAMGASRGVVVRGVLLDALRTAGPGLLVGGLLAAGTAAALRSMLLGLNPVDPISYLYAGALLLVVVVVSSLGPAMRASGIHPMDALRGS